MTDNADTDTLTLPTQSVDESETLNERLTNNVIHNVITRYAVRDEAGTPQEDWGDIFRRVAENLAVPEFIHAVSHDVQYYNASDIWADWVDPEADVPGEEPYELSEEIGSYLSYEGILSSHTGEHVGSEPLEQMEEYAHAFEKLMRTQQFMPNSPTLMNAGTELQQLSACFVTEPGDSMAESSEEGRASILETAQDAGEVFRSGGGVGYPFHHLRPKGARVSSTGGVSSGPVSFMEIFDSVCGTVKQGGKRRGAQMGIMHVQHPDIGRFVTAKRGEENLTNFNISAALTDDFLEAVENDEQYTLFDPREGWIDPEGFNVVPETVHFYDPAYEDAWNDEYDKPGMGLDGKVVETNFWRDLQEQMQDPSAFDEFRDRIEVVPGEPLELPARFVWQLIIDGAHNNGEPGFVHLDNINNEHSFDVEVHSDEFIHSTNPCAEQPLRNYEACNLGHVNFSLLVSEDAPTFDQYLSENLPEFETYSESLDSLAAGFLEEALDTAQFDHVTSTGARFLDNVVTMSKFPLEEIEETVRTHRKVGVGMMGLHQALLQLGVDYGSRHGQAVAKALTKRLDRVATETSHELAGERGVFEAYDDSKWADPTEYPEWVNQHGHVDPMAYEDGYELRNHNLTTVAPTGTTSMIGDTSGGCEPIFNVAYFKNVSDDVQGDEMLVEFDDYFLEALEANDVDVDAVREEAQELMLDNEFNGPSDLETVPDALADVFTTSDELSVDDHIEMQAAIQTYIDSGVSKCVSEGTVIQTDDGLRRVEELGNATEADPETFSDPVDTSIDGNDVTEHYNAGVKPATTVRLDNGRELTAASQSHHVKTTDGWKLVSELSEGDHLLGSFAESHGDGAESISYTDTFNTSAKEITTPDQMSVDLARWLGMIAADGHTIESSGEVGITHACDPVGDAFITTTESVFGVTPWQKEDSRTEDVMKVGVTSRNLVRFTEQLIGSGAYEKHVPEQILHGSKEEKLAFVEGLTLDGYNNRDGFTVYEGMSEGLARDTASLLESFGETKLRVQEKYVEESDATSYGVTVSGELQDLITAIEPHKNNDTVDVRQKVYVPTSEYSLDDYETGTAAYYAARSALNRGNDYLFDETAEKIGVEYTQPVYRVTDVSDAGEVQMYDIEVEDTHQYPSNGVISHNTLNVANDTTIEEVGDAIQLATSAGIKGATIYRDGSRQEQVLTTRTDNELDEALTDDQLLEEVADRFEAGELASELATRDVNVTATGDTGTPEPVETEVGE